MTEKSYMAKLKIYITEKIHLEFRNGYKKYIRIFKRLEKILERKLIELARRWQIPEESAEYGQPTTHLFGLAG